MPLINVVGVPGDSILLNAKGRLAHKNAMRTKLCRHISNSNFTHDGLGLLLTLDAKADVVMDTGEEPEDACDGLANLGPPSLSSIS